MDKKEEICQSLNLDEASLQKFLKENPNLTLDDLASISKFANKQQELNDRLLYQFERNMQCFKENYKDIYDKFVDFKPLRSFEFFLSDDGSANLQFIDNKDILYKNQSAKFVCKKQYDDVKDTLVTNCLHYDTQVDLFGQVHLRYFNEAIALMDANGYKDGKLLCNKTHFMPHLIMFGIGLGYVLDYLYKDFIIANLLVLEPNCDIFYASLYAYDWATLIERQKDSLRSIDFIVGTTDVYESWLEYYTKNGAFLAACRATYIHYLNDDINRLIDLYNTKFYALSASLGIFDDGLFGLSHATNNLKKGYPLVRQSVSISDKFKHSPVFVVGNGPSLDRDIAFLRKNQDKGIVIACGSAIDTLFNAGIQVDIYVATERMAYISQTLDIFDNSEFLKNILCAGSCILHPDVFAHFDDVVIFDKAGECFREGLILNGADEFNDWGALEFINPLVGNSGLSTAIAFGFKNIYLFGMDNGKAIDGAMHSKYSDLYGKKYGLNEKSPLAGKDIMLKGNFGGDIMSNQLYKSSCDSFERLLKAHSDDKDLVCHNCSNGAFVNYTKAIKSSDIDMSLFDVIDKRELKDHIKNDLCYSPKIPESVLDIMFSSSEFDKIADSIIQVFEKKCTSRDEVILLLRAISTMLAKLRMSKFSVIAHTINAAAQYFFILATTVLCSKEDDYKALLDVNAILERFIYFMQDGKYVFSFVPNYLESHHITLLKGKIGLDHENSKAPCNVKAFVLIDTKQKGILKGKFKKVY